jgi:hypothetical protein
MSIFLSRRAWDATIAPRPGSPIRLYIFCYFISCMSIFSAIPGVGAVAGVLLMATLPVLGQAPDSTVSRPQGTLVKLGTGIVPGFEFSGYRGLSFPLALGAEHHLTSDISLYVNGFSGFNIGTRNRYSDGSREPVIGDYGFQVGARRYYNQEKRRQKGRATGPFVGNYLALQTSSVFNPSYYRSYRYSTLAAIWGMQRQLGKYGWFDAYAGLGLGRESKYSSIFRGESHYGLLPELGIKLSLGSRLTHQR